MRWIAVIALAAACGTPSSATPSAAPAASTPAEPTALARRENVDVAALVAAKAAGAVVIDVRTDEEWAEGHVPGAVHVPLATLSPTHPEIAKLPKDQPVYFICRSGGRSARAADQMASAGYKAMNVEGGTMAWIEAGNPLETPGATP